MISDPRLLSQNMAIIMQASTFGGVFVPHKRGFCFLCHYLDTLLECLLSDFFTWGLVDGTVFFFKYTVFFLLFCKLPAVYISEKNISMGRNGGLPL